MDDFGTSGNSVLSYNSGDECTSDDKFYNPICLTGYLTPLQRKKLREKRNLQLEMNFSDEKKSSTAQKQRNAKRKKEYILKISGKESKKIKRPKEPIPTVHCSAAKIVFKAAGCNVKDKKFFKTSSESRLQKANFTMPLIFKKNVFLNIDKCVKETLAYSKKRPLHKENSKITNNAKPLGELTTNAIEDEKNSPDHLKSALQSCPMEVSTLSYITNSSSENEKSFVHISDSEKEKSVFDFDWPSDELLLKRQENARAVMKQLICSKESNVAVDHNDTEKEDQSLDDKPVKLYPVFEFAIKKKSKSVQENKAKSPRSVTKKRIFSCRGEEQLIIDAGQKEIGAKLCSTCNMIYTIGEEQDEELHKAYHHMYLINLKFPGWKNETVIGEYEDGRVIMVRNNDKSLKLKKIEDILIIANRDLGFPSSAVPSKPDLTFVLFISSSKRVSGCIVAEPISSACQVLLADTERHKDLADEQKEPIWRIGNWYSSSEPVPAICGINRIWVAHNFRRQKMASRMLDCLRCHFIHGHIIGIRELAFTDPTPVGRGFAAAYTGTDNFLVYK